MIRKIAFSWTWFPLIVLAVAVLAFGRWSLTAGYFWDDFPIRWIIYEYGMPGLQRYYAIDRPLMAWVYQVTTSFIDFTPLTSQLFALVWRAISGAALWALLRLVWPKHTHLAGWAALFFVIYPGFGQQYVSFVYGHYYLLVVAFLGSLSLTIMAVRDPRRFWPYTAAALLLSAANLFSWEYYFLLDLLRPLLVAWVLGEQSLALKIRLRRAFTVWLPYLAVFLAAIYWRTSVLGYQTYQPVFFSALQAAPLKTLLFLGQRILHDFFEAGLQPWWKAVQTVGLGIRDIWYVLVVAASAVLVAVYFAGQAAGRRVQNVAAILSTSLAALLLAGGPFWLIDQDINLYFSNDRFVLPYMLGGSLLLVALASLLPRRVQVPLLALLVGLSAGVQYHNGIAYRGEWEQARRLFWQMSWRIPGLEPHTTLLLNDSTFTYYTDISFSAPLNWIYQPIPAGKMDYMLLYPSIRLGGKIPDLAPNQTIAVDYRSDQFAGSTSQVIVLNYQEPGCLRVVDPQVEAENTAVQPILLQALPLSETRWISAAPTGQIPEEIFGAAPAGTWCEVFERADLARQLRDWDAVIQNWKTAQAAELWPLDAVEYLPFVEAFAHIGAWDSALDLSRLAAQPGSQYPGMVCRLWERIERETAAGPEKAQALRQVRLEFGCE